MEIQIYNKHLGILAMVVGGPKPYGRTIVRLATKRGADLWQGAFHACPRKSRRRRMGACLDTVVPKR